MNRIIFTGMFTATLISAAMILILISVINTSRMQQINNADITVDSLLKFIEDEDALVNNDSFKSLNTVEISKRNDNEGNTFYFANTISQFMWSSELYMLVVEDGKITSIIDTGLGGNNTYFSYDVVSISQGVFISAFCATHSGNGDLLLMPIYEPNNVKYLIPDAVDSYYEESELTAIDYEISEVKGKGTASSVYLGGKLHASYIDVNQDGHTDIVLKGIQQIYETGQDQEQLLKQEHFVTYVYLYDPMIDSFIFDLAMSKKVIV